MDYYFFFHIFKQIRIRCVWRLLGSVFMVIRFFGLDFMVMVGQHFDAQSLKKKKKKTVQCIKDQHHIHFSR